MILFLDTVQCMLVGNKCDLTNGRQISRYISYKQKYVQLKLFYIITQCCNKDCSREFIESNFKSMVEVLKLNCYFIFGLS